jgi:hypothetical protein
MGASTTRKAVRGLAGLVAASSLAVAVAMPALASHVEPEWVDGNPNCETLGLSDELKIDESDIDADATATYSNASGEITITSNAARTEFSFSDANPPIDAIILKAGSGANVYLYDPAAVEDDGLQTPLNDGGQQAEISHITVCFGEMAEETPTPEVTPTPAGETPVVTPTPAGEEPTATPHEDTQGGTPAPSGGSVPNTAAQPWTGVPASVLGLVLLASLGAVVYLRLAQDPTKR